MDADKKYIDFAKTIIYDVFVTLVSSAFALYSRKLKIIIDWIVLVIIQTNLQCVP